MSKRLVLTPDMGSFWHLEHKYTRKYKSFNLEVPKGFITDLASIPRILWAILPPFGDYTKAAVIHDYYCIFDKVFDDRAFVDRMFYDLMIEDGTPKTIACLMYLAVRAAYLIKHGGKKWKINNH